MKEAARSTAIARPRTHLYVVLDASDSMDTIRPATVSAFNEFIGKQQAKRVDEIFVTLIRFSDAHQIKTLYESKPVAEVPRLTVATFVPDGFTAMRDGIGVAIAHADKHTGEGDRVLVATITDGEENASVKIRSNAELKRLVKARIALGNWTFLLIGANIKSAHVADEMGFGAGNAQDFNADDIGSAMATVADNLVAYRESDDLQTDTFHNPPKRWKRTQWAQNPNVVLTDND